MLLQKWGKGIFAFFALPGHFQSHCCRWSPRELSTPTRQDPHAGVRMENTRNGGVVRMKDLHVGDPGTEGLQRRLKAYLWGQQKGLYRDNDICNG